MKNQGSKDTDEMEENEGGDGDEFFAELGLSKIKALTGGSCRHSRYIQTYPTLYLSRFCSMGDAMGRPNIIEKACDVHLH